MHWSLDLGSGLGDRLDVGRLRNVLVRLLLLQRRLLRMAGAASFSLDVAAGVVGVEEAGSLTGLDTDVSVVEVPDVVEGSPAAAFAEGSGLGAGAVSLSAVAGSGLSPFAMEGETFLAHCPIRCISRQCKCPQQFASAHIRPCSNAGC